MATCDVILKSGIKIPKGAVVLGNIYATHRDESVWKNPNVFNPRRFLDSDGLFQSNSNFQTFSQGGG